MPTSSAPTRSAAPATSRRSGARSSRSSFPTPRRRTRPPSASPRARPSPRSPPSAGSPTRTSISARVTKAGIIDRAVADAAFALKEGEVSAPVQGRFGTALVRVVKIEPEQVRAFEEVAAELKQELATERAKAEMLSVYDKIEDERSLGKTLAEAAEKLKLASRTVEVDRSGRDSRGHAGRRPARPAAAVGRRVHNRDRRRERPAAGRRRLCLVRGHRHHARARAHARRGEGPGRGALARGRDRHAPEGQGDRDPRQAQGRHRARRCRRRRRPQGRDQDRRQARRGRCPAVGARGRCDLPHRQGRHRQRRRRAGRRAGRVPRHRYRGAERRWPRRSRQEP